MSLSISEIRVISFNVVGILIFHHTNSSTVGIFEGRK